MSSSLSIRSPFAPYFESQRKNQCVKGTKQAARLMVAASLIATSIFMTTTSLPNTTLWPTATSISILGIGLLMTCDSKHFRNKTALILLALAINQITANTAPLLINDSKETEGNILGIVGMVLAYIMIARGNNKIFGGNGEGLTLPCVKAFVTCNVIREEIHEEILSSEES